MFSKARVNIQNKKIDKTALFININIVNKSKSICRVN